MYRAGDGTEASGRDAVLAAMRDSVNAFDRQLDAREMADVAPVQEGSRVSVNWTSTYRLSGVPDLVMSGTETASFDGDVIALLTDVFDEGVAERAAEWFEAHGDRLS